MPILAKIANSLATVNGAILNDEQSLVSEKQVGVFAMILHYTYQTQS